MLAATAIALLMLFPSGRHSPQSQNLSTHLQVETDREADTDTDTEADTDTDTEASTDKHETH